ncbi:MAG: hypothetical protein ACK559_15365, partial [bacterium]
LLVEVLLHQRVGLALLQPGVHPHDGHGPGRHGRGDAVPDAHAGQVRGPPSGGGGEVGEGGRVRGEPEGGAHIEGEVQRGGPGGVQALELAELRPADQQAPVRQGLDVAEEALLVAGLPLVGPREGGRSGPSVYRVRSSPRAGAEVRRVAALEHQEATVHRLHA